MIGLVLVVKLLHLALALFAETKSVSDIIVENGLRYDAWWYVRIANEGYPTGDPAMNTEDVRMEDQQSPWAFFPLYPLAVKVVAWFIGDTVGAMYILSWVFVVAASWIVLCFAGSELGPHRAPWVLAALLLSPMGLYLHVYYTEALFLSLLIGAFLGVRTKHLAWSALCAALLVLVRPNGFAMLLPLALFQLEVRGLSVEQSLRKVVPTIKMLAFLLPALLAFAGYGWYQWVQTGTPFAFAEAQAGWNRHWTWPFLAFFRSGDVATQVESTYTLVLIALAVAVRSQLTLSFNVLIWISILLPLCSGSVDSMIRFTLPLFPLFLLFGSWLYRSQWRWALISVSLMIQLFMWWLWLKDHLLMA